MSNRSYSRKRPADWLPMTRHAFPAARTDLDDVRHDIAYRLDVLKRERNRSGFVIRHGSGLYVKLGSGNPRDAAHTTLHMAAVFTNRASAELFRDQMPNSVSKYGIGRPHVMAYDVALQVEQERLTDALAALAA